jgi:hypothetical protein
MDSTGNFTTPINLGNMINGTGYEVEASVTHDGNYLFFISKRSGDLNENPYWVDAGIIDKLNPFTGIDEESGKIPDSIILFQNYPNPFNPSTVITFSLNKKQLAQISIYNVRGELVKELLNGATPAGINKVAFDASGLNSGVYFYKLSTSEKTVVNKMILIK